MGKTTSEGQCLFCAKTFKKAGINRHLGKYLAEKSVQGRRGKSYLVKIETDASWGRTPYFLSLWIDGKTEMGEIDDFLRAIWLECCDHMSSFVIPKRRGEHQMFDFFEAEKLCEKGKIKEYEAFMEQSRGEIPMGRMAEETFHQDLKLHYTYDYGNTTELDVTVIGEYPIGAEEPIVLLSRNEPLNISCESCGKQPASELCSVCYGSGEDGLFCKKCAKQHAKGCEDFADYAAMPMVNSPRMGVCGYMGGEIDTKRDGILRIAK